MTNKNKSVDNEPGSGESTPIIGENQEHAQAGVDKAQQAKAIQDKPVEDSGADQSYDMYGSVHEDSILNQLSNEKIHEIWNRPWDDVNILTAPEPLDGMVQRWVRTSISNDDDYANVTQAVQEGWIPRPASTVPKDVLPPTINDGRYAGCIVTRGMLLCHMPKDRAAKKRQQERDAVRKQTESIQRPIDDANQAHIPGLGIGRIGATNESTVSRGAPPAVAQNE